ncbi:phosphoglycerate mutase family protein [Streptomyces sp. NBC_01314]|uniref:phosphoglycerate mutase family protein n=1 Tax=Streptomyces sp. NBC_01314 TaxID=2903821 RepID=UPI00308D3812|nr:histidine phosphatase family protein [Streptomyces sp. NBC_01314]
MDDTDIDTDTAITTAPAPGEGIAPPYTLASLWVIRHGQSTANAASAEAERTGSAVPLPGRGADVPLSDLGRAQAGALGGWLAGIAGDQGPELVVCSPYVRARQTWESMAGIRAWPRLRCSSTSGCGTGRWGSSRCIRRVGRR